MTLNNMVIDGRRGSNLKILGDSLPSFVQDIDQSNTVDNKPIYYMVNQRDAEVPSDGGFVALVGSVNMSLRNSYLQGLLIAYTNDSLLQLVNISDSSVGIEMLFSSGNKIANTTVRFNDWGVLLVDSRRNSLFGNNITENTDWGIGVGGPNGSNENFIEENLITYNSHCGMDVYGKNNTIARNQISYNWNGLLLDASFGNIVVGNDISNNSMYGIYLIRDSHENIIIENSIKSNDCGIFIADPAGNNTIYHNSLIYNRQQSVTFASNWWDNGFEGNYWGGYLEIDADEDGILDTPYLINQYNKDNFPLAGIFYRFDAANSSVTVISNSTVVGFEFNQTAIKFNVSGGNETVAFCRVRIPKALLGEGPYTVTVDGFLPLLLKELVATNDTYEYLYFGYSQKMSQEVVVVVEFPISAAVIFVIASLALVVILNRKLRDRLPIYKR
jgi:parallel beta-helix repeat protein